MQTQPCRHSICNTDLGGFGRGLIGLTAIVVILTDICLYGLGQEWCFIAWFLRWAFLNQG